MNDLHMLVKVIVASDAGSGERNADPLHILSDTHHLSLSSISPSFLYDEILRNFGFLDQSRPSPLATDSRGRPWPNVLRTAVLLSLARDSVRVVLDPAHDLKALVTAIHMLYTELDAAWLHRSSTAGRLASRFAAACKALSDHASLLGVRGALGLSYDSLRYIPGIYQVYT